MTAITSIEELVAACELSDIVYYEVSGKRRDGFQDLSAGPEDGAEAQAQVMQRLDGTKLEVRCRNKVEAKDAVYMVDVAALFRVPDGLTISDEVISEFVTGVGVMALYPYLREAVSQMSTKIRAGHLTLSLLKSGETVLTEDSGSLP